MMEKNSIQDKAGKAIRWTGGAIAGCAWIWLMGWVLFLIGVTMVRPADPVENTDAIIVVTGGQNRVNTGLDLLHQGKAHYLFISGVNRNVTVEQIVRLWKPGMDSIPCCIVLGHAANNTEGNARESSQWVRQQDLRSIRLVTSNYHLPRAWIEFTHALPRRRIIAHPVKSVALEDGSRDYLRLSFSEYNKTLLTWFRLNIYPWDRLMEPSR
jgi:uncharacterized SAM-binding protein YcdF (DUF218 family)